MDPMTIAAIASAATGVGGALSAARDQRRNYAQAEDKLRENRSWIEFDPKSQRMLDMEGDSRRNYLYQQALQDRLEGQSGFRYGLENQAGGVYEDLMSGAAYEYTPTELNRARDFSNLQTQRTGNEVNRFLDERLAGISSDAAGRGLRGQAVTQLETGATTAAADLLQRRLLEQQMQEMNMLDQMSGRRIQGQAGAAGAMQNYGTGLQQQAISNRQIMQNPALLNMLREDRKMQGVQIAPNAAYGQAVLGAANTPSDLTAGLQAFGGSGGPGMLGNMMGGGGAGAGTGSAAAGPMV